MGTPETSREPCPDRILDDVGGAFAMGAVGGSIFHYLKGTYASPKGERLSGGVQAIRMNSGRIGGSFAVWGGLFSTFDCSMVYLRQKEDPWNSIIAGAATGGFLQMRQGLGPASRSALFGGVLLALIEGAGIMLNKMMSQAPPMIMEDPNMMPPNMGPGNGNMGGMMGGMMGGFMGSGQPQQQGSPNMMPPMQQEQGGSSQAKEGGWLGGVGGWFGIGGGEKKEEGGGGGSETKVLESFDSPTPMPSFEYK